MASFLCVGSVQLAASPRHRRAPGPWRVGCLAWAHARLIACFGATFELETLSQINIAMAAAIVRHEIAHDKGMPFKVTYLSGNSSQTVPLVMRKMNGVEKGYAGLGGTNVGNKKYDAKIYSKGDVAVRVNDHKGAEYRFQQIQEVLIIDNNDQAELREQANKFRHEHELCRTKCIEADYCVALERAGLPTGTFSNVNSYGANVAVSHSDHHPKLVSRTVTLTLRSP